VLEADSSGRRIRLSITAVQHAREADEVRAYSQREGAALIAASATSPADISARCRDISTSPRRERGTLASVPV
jgi:hypothetical protein